MPVSLAPFCSMILAPPDVAFISQGSELAWGKEECVSGDYAARQTPQTFSFIFAHRCEHGNLIYAHLHWLMKLSPAITRCLDCNLCSACLCFYDPTVSSASGGKLDVHNDQMDLQVAYVTHPFLPGMVGGDGLWGFMKGRAWRSGLSCGPSARDEAVSVSAIALSPR